MQYILMACRRNKEPNLMKYNALGGLSEGMGSTAKMFRSSKKRGRGASRQ